MTIFVSIDPGQDGYSCILPIVKDAVENPCTGTIDARRNDMIKLYRAGFGPDGMFPLFFPAPVRDGTRVGKESECDPQGTAALVKLWECLGVEVAIVEEQQGFPGYGARCFSCGKFKNLQGVASTFQTGAGFGYWIGALAARGIRTIIVPSLEWKGAMGLDVDKDKSRALAAKLGPGIEFKALERTPKARKADHNKAESFLLGIYGRRLIK